MQVHESLAFSEDARESELCPKIPLTKGLLKLKNSLNKDFQDLLGLVCEALPEFQSYDARQIAVSIGRSKNRSKYGVWAHVAPLRHFGGKRERKSCWRGIAGAWVYDLQQIEGIYPEARYLMTFVLPKFFRLSFRERIETVVHELYHLHPEFRGDLRRFPAPHIHHGPTPAAFRRRVHDLTSQCLARFPELNHHPLLHCGEESFAERKGFRLDLPKRHFLRHKTPSPPAPLTEMRPLATERPRWVSPHLWSFMKKVLLSGLTIAALAVHSQSPSRSPLSVEVQVTRPGFLLDKPELQRGERLRSLQRFESFQAKKLNHDRTWVYLEDRQGRGGWLPRTQVKVVEQGPLPVGDLNQSLESEKADPQLTLEKEETPDSLPVNYRGDEEIEDPVVLDPRRPPEELSVGREAFLNRDGRLYALPNPKSERMGVLERDDVIAILEHSPQGKWVRGRLKETGEEGWIPLRWLEEVRPDQALGKFFEVQIFQVESAMAYATKEHNLGAGGGLWLRGRRPISEGKWVRNIQVGLETAYFLGSKTVVATTGGLEKTYSVKYLVTSLLSRYMFSPRATSFAFAPELGLVYQKAFVNTDGIEDADLASAKISRNPSYWGVTGGMRGFVGISETFYTHGGIRAYFMSDSFLYVDIGLGLRF